MAWTPPNITQPRYVSSPTLRFSYPGNWTIDTADPDYDPHSNLFIEPPFQDAGVQITIDDSDEELDVLLDAGVHLMRANARDVRTMGAFSNWGRYTGKGQTLAATNEGTRYTIRLFVANLEGGRVLHIHEVTADSDQASVEPGLELIRSTFSAR